MRKDRNICKIKEILKTKGEKTPLHALFVTLFVGIFLFNPTGLYSRPNPAQKFAQKPVGPGFTTKVDTIASEVLQKTGVPSASVAVVRHGKIVYLHAYGAAKLHPRVAANTSMRYAIGSISKQFTSASILLLEQQGKLSLEDHISKWLPGLTRANEVTLREVLSHTSGYQDFWPQDYVPPMMQKPMSPRKILNRWAKKPLDFAPGTKWQYSNTNYLIAAQIVEKISGEPIYTFVKQHILSPLNMSSVVNYDKGKMTDQDPTGYMRYGLGPLRHAKHEGAGWMSGAAELAMTPRDLAKWDISIINESLLQPQSYKQLETEVRLKSGVGTNYGLGVDVRMMDGHRLISHSGEVSGFTAENMVFPDDSAAVVVLTNQMAASAAGTIARRISGLLFNKQDKQTAMRTRQARKIFLGLEQGNIDRSLFTPDANAYFSKQALSDFKSSLGPLGEPKRFFQTSQSKRGGMIERSFRVVFPNRTLRVWTYQKNNGKLEQYQIAPEY
ncbi:MAG TPA: serine hydrolase domain-containing protein [Balneolaceae bacterium]|nr:serine hydrolase domain-containing protein [Balneolaceae bacterium]